MPNKVEWISVEDRLPNSNPVLVYLPEFKLMIVAVFDSHKEIFHLESYPAYYWFINEVTHWAELPEPPESE